MAVTNITNFTGDSSRTQAIKLCGGEPINQNLLAVSPAK